MVERLNLSHLRFLLQPRLLERDGLPRVLGLGGAQLPLRLPDLQFEVRIRQHHDDGVGSHLGAGVEHDLLDPPGGPGTHEKHILRHQCARSADLPQKLAAFDLAGPDNRFLDRRRSRFQRHEEPGQRDQGHAAGNVHDVLAGFALGFSFDVYHRTISEREHCRIMLHSYASHVPH